MNGTRKVRLHPSILSADFARLEADLLDLEPHADGWHLDIMDGVFVPNISFGPVVVEAVRRVTSLPLHCHLMIVDPQRYVSAFRAAGADTILVHIETLGSPGHTLAAVRASGASVGLTLNPETPLDAVFPWLKMVDELLVMSVHPGFGGQKFQTEAVGRVREAAAFRERAGLEFSIAIDGGIGPSNARTVTDAGADILVAGTSVFKAVDRRAAVEAMRGA